MAGPPSPEAAAVATVQPISSDTCRLPNGLKIRYTGSIEEIEMLWREHFCDLQYLQHGVTLPRGGTVIDVGGHVGLFACFAAQALGPGGAVVSVEPAPASYACCVTNAAACAAWGASETGAAAGGVAPISVVDAACGDGSTDEMALTVFDRAMLMNTLVAGKRQEEMSTAFVKSKLVDGRAAGTGFERVLIRVAHKLFKLKAVAPLLEKGLRNHVRFHILSRRKQVPVRVVTVSQIMRDAKLSSVDLLKCDAELAEMMVLRGVDAADWPKIKQVALEVHSEELREPVLQLLRGVAGFDAVTVVPGDDSLGPGVYNVWARRR